MTSTQTVQDGTPAAKLIAEIKASPDRVVELVRRLANSAASPGTDEQILERVIAALPEPRTLVELGAGIDRKNLDSRVVALLDKYFKSVALSENGLEFKTKAVPDKKVSDLITELAGLIKTLHKINLAPSRYLVGTITNYDQALTVIEDRQVFGVDGSHNKDREQMQTHLSEQRPIMSFAKRENGASVVGVLLKTLLTGENPLKNQELRDSVGALYSFADGLDGDRGRDGSVSRRFRSFGSRN